MDEPQSDTKKMTQAVVDNTVPAALATLEVYKIASYLTAKNKIKRDISISELTESLKRRCSLKPRKRLCTETIKWNPVHKVEFPKKYPKKSFKSFRKRANLETIHEEKDSISENFTHMSVKRYSTIQFQDTPSGRKSPSIEMMINKLNIAGTESSAVIDSETK
ncbi:uncharacterized protein LOC122398301 isoform X2 [Colletes gigas]|nr:uncharacterized protein LOC122398301 isoform X2 [Colletes gigas]XP_043253963.1 uncharacterized protein LOC122398301 isoform X2 [Colletes gigas]